MISFERLIYFGYIFEHSGMIAKKGSSQYFIEMPKIVFGKRAVKHSESPPKIK